MKKKIIKKNKNAEGRFNNIDKRMRTNEKKKGSTKKHLFTICKIIERIIIDKLSIRYVAIAHT